MKEVGKLATTRRLAEYKEKNYPNLEAKETDNYRVLKITTETEIISLIADEYGRVSEKTRARRGTKSSSLEKNREISATKEDEKKSEKEASGSDKEGDLREEPVTVKSFSTVNSCIAFKEEDIVESIYTGKRYIVIASFPGYIKLKEEGQDYSTFEAASTDFLRKIN